MVMIYFFLLAFPDTPQRHANSPRVRRNAKDTRDKYQETEMVSVVPIPWADRC